MAKYDVVISDKATGTLHRIIDQLKSTSLIGAEDARTQIINRIKKLCVNPMANSRQANFQTIDGNIRSALAWNYRIYYLIEDSRIVVLDIILDKEKESDN